MFSFTLTNIDQLLRQHLSKNLENINDTDFLWIT